MVILGIETSCDETAISLLEVKNGKIKVLSNAISSQVKLHAKYGGVFPSLAAREHVKNLPRVLKLALNAIRYTLNAIDLIAVTAGPGLISSLLVGTTFAKTLAYKHEKPVIGVNHLEGHIYSNWLRPVGEFSIFNFQFSKEKVFPALCLIVSGGHTQLILMKDHGKYKLIGETLDDAAGEAFDKIARILGLGYPGGPIIAAEAAKFKNQMSPPKADPPLAEKIKMTDQKLEIKLPRPMINSKNYDFSFAGLKTSVLYLVRDLLKNREAKKLDSKTVAAISAAAQEAIVDVLIAKTIRAAREYKVKSIMLSGGVSANSLLRQRLKDEGLKLGLPVFIPYLDYTTDNAAMIAIAGYFKAKNAKRKAKNLNWRNVRADASWEIV